MRRQSREIALQALFQTEFSDSVAFNEFLSLYEEKASPDVLTYCQTLIEGVLKNKTAIDDLIQAASRHWKLQRIALVDKNILRIAVFEMKFAAEPLKPSIAIDEAVEIAKKYGSTDSGAFVNGLLDQIGRQK